MSASILHFLDKDLLKKQVFNSDGTFTVPKGVKNLIIVAWGGGGGGAGSDNAQPGGGGGDTLFGSLVRAPGAEGGRGRAGDLLDNGGGRAFLNFHSGGTGSDDTVDATAGQKSLNGFPGGDPGVDSSVEGAGGGGGAGPGGKGGNGGDGPNAGTPGESAAANSGGGGGGQGGGADKRGGHGGAGSTLLVELVTVTPENNYSVTIGPGGQNGGTVEGDGGTGKLIVYWVEPD